MGKNRKLITVLSNVPIAELNRFQKFANSPYLNPSNKLSAFINSIVLAIKDKELFDEKYSAEKLLGKNYKDLELRKAYSDGFKLYQKFKGIESYLANPHLLLSTEFKAIQKDGREVFYNSISKSIELQRKYISARSGNYFYHQFLNEQTSFNLKSQFEKKNKKIKDLSEFNFSSMAENLDKFYIYEQLKILLNIESWKRLRNLDLNHPNKSQVLSHINDEILDNEPIINILFNLYLTYTDPENTDVYYKLRSLIKENKYAIPPEDHTSIYEALVSYTVSKLNKGNSEFGQESFEVYEEMIVGTTYDQNSFLDPSYYRNIVVIALRLGKVDWVDQFIHEYQVYINPAYRANSYHYAKTTLAFYNKDFEKVIQLLQMVEYEDVWYNINSKSMLLAAYYELQEFEPLDNLINSFKVFISRTKDLSKNRKQNYLNYLKFVGKMSNLDSTSEKAIYDLEDSIKKTSGVVSKKWLLEKIDEMKSLQ